MAAKRMPWTQGQNKQLHALGKTHSANQLAALTGHSVNAVYAQAKRIGANLIKSGEKNGLSRHSDSDVELARSLADEDLTPEFISKKLGVPVGTIKGWISYRSRTEEASDMPRKVNHDVYQTKKQRDDFACYVRSKTLSGKVKRKDLLEQEGVSKGQLARWSDDYQKSVQGGVYQSANYHLWKPTLQS